MIDLNKVEYKYLCEVVPREKFLECLKEMEIFDDITTEKMHNFYKTPRNFKYCFYPDSPVAVSASDTAFRILGFSPLDPDNPVFTIFYNGEFENSVLIDIADLTQAYINIGSFDDGLTGFKGYVMGIMMGFKSLFPDDFYNRVLPMLR